MVVSAGWLRVSLRSWPLKGQIWAVASDGANMPPIKTRMKTAVRDTAAGGGRLRNFMFRSHFRRFQWLLELGVGFAADGETIEFWRATAHLAFREQLRGFHFQTWAGDPRLQNATEWKIAPRAEKRFNWRLRCSARLQSC